MTAAVRRRPSLQSRRTRRNLQLAGSSRNSSLLDGAAWLGVTLKDVTADKARDLKLPGEYGALVESVDADSAAAKAGLQKGDVIVEFAGERVRSEAQLRRLIRETPAGRTVSLQVIRDGQARTLNAKLQSRTNHFNIQVPEIHIPPINPQLFDFRGFNFPFDGGRPSLGISGDELTTQLASYFGVKQGKGVLVREVVVGSPAEKAGLKAGDVIVAVDGKSVATVTELRQALEIKPSRRRTKGQPDSRARSARADCACRTGEARAWRARENGCEFWD